MERNRKRDELSMQVVDRFYQAFYSLDLSVTDFCNEIGIHRPAFYKQKLDYSIGILDFSWLIYILKYGVSSQWLLTGAGEMFVKSSKKQSTISR